MKGASLYIDQASPVHRADARVKLIALLIFSVAIFFFDAWWEMGAACLVLLAAFAFSRLPARSIFLTVVPVYVLVAVTVALNALAFGGDAGVVFSAEGLAHGCFLALRICLLVWASLIVCYSTTSTQLMSAFLWFLRPLRSLCVPVDDIAMALSIALRFIPLIAAGCEQVKQAQWSRGATFDEGGPMRRIRAYAAVLTPLIVGLFRQADRLAMAMDARCYGMEKARSRCYDDGH